MAYPVGLLIIGSIASSVALVVVNKIVFGAGFPYVFTLSTMHFIVTWGLLRIMGVTLGLFTPKYLPMYMNFLVGGFGVGSICLMNFSLQYNSVGFYQMLKLLVVPCCLVINYFSYSEIASTKTKITLTFVLLGVGIATITDVELNLLGSIMGLAAVVVTAQFQIWQGKKQGEYSVSSNQLALSTAFAQIFIGGALAIIFEGKSLLDKFNGNSSSDEQKPITLYLLSMILFSCLLAVSVNVHSFALIGKTSAVTFQVVGHGKTCLILGAGYFQHITGGGSITDLFRNMIGVAIALVAVAFYSNLQVTKEQNDWCDRINELRGGGQTRTYELVEETEPEVV